MALISRASKKRLEPKTSVLIGTPHINWPKLILTPAAPRQWLVVVVLWIYDTQGTLKSF